MTYRKINELRNWSDNPRSIKPERFQELKNRITRFGQFKPVIITPDGEVLGGNMRLKAMKELGIEDIWVSVVEPKSDAEKIEIALTDNEEMGFYEDKQLADLIEKYKGEIELGDYSIHLGEPISLDDLLAKFGPEPEEDEAPEVSQDEPISKLGEVYQLGRHRVMCGDSTKIEDVERLMDGKKADMVFTDPPYNVAGESKNFAADVSKSMNNLKNSDWDKDFDVWEVVPLLQSFVKEDSTTYIFTSHFLFGELYKAYKDWADFTNYCVWHKPNPMPSLSKRHWTWNTELCLYATKGKHTFNFPDGENALSGWVTNKHSDGTHPTQKPIELCVNPITKSSKSNDLVIDLFLGSGSTLIACEQTNRTCYGMELDPKYTDVIRKRYSKLISPETWEDEWQKLTPALQ